MHKQVHVFLVIIGNKLANTASCSFSFMEKASGEVSLSALKDLQAQVRFKDGVVLLEDIPDNCRANLRYKKSVRFSTMDLPNLLWVDNGCSAHILYKLTTAVCLMQ